MPAYDYAAVADIYDDFCVFDEDIPFFQRQVEPVRGPILELMAGTGRVSLPMIEAGADLTCVDSSVSMLGVFKHKLEGRDVRARLLCADVRMLPFHSTFDMMVLPFQGFTELVGDESQRTMFSEVARLLAPLGRFVCTSHNPAFRGGTVDGQWRELGRFRNKDRRTLVLHFRAQHSQRPDVVEGLQKIEVLDEGGGVIESRIIELEFSLVGADAIVRMGDAAGLRLEVLLGDYNGSPFDEHSSPAVIALFEKPA
jgi:SAM-dependent methyltransferase